MAFWQRAYCHIISMQTCNPDLPLGRHVTQFHDGGDWNKVLLQREQQWIFRLNVTSFPGLNEAV